MSRIARLVVYESDSDDAIKKQLDKSLLEGIHQLAVKITIINLSDTPALNDLLEQLIIK